jgi:hypothetical protein
MIGRGTDCRPAIHRAHHATDLASLRPHGPGPRPINGRALDRPLWRDTFVLTKTTGDSLTFASNFVDFPGTFVERCYVLSHKDLEMMAAIEVVP